MVKLTKLDHAVSIGQDVVFNLDATVSWEVADDTKVVLLSWKGADMVYQSSHSVIDYPGEYDVQDIAVKGWADKNGTMNYIVGLGKQHVVIVQSKSFLTKEDMPESVDTRIFADTKLVKLWESMEYEGKYMDLSVEGCVVEDTTKPAVVWE